MKTNYQVKPMIKEVDHLIEELLLNTLLQQILLHEEEEYLKMKQYIISFNDIKLIKDQEIVIAIPYLINAIVDDYTRFKYNEAFMKQSKIFYDLLLPYLMTLKKNNV